MAEEATVTETEPVEVESTETEAPEVQTDWKAESRKWERYAKKHQKDLTETQTKLKEKEDLDKSVQEKAIEAARNEGMTKAQQAAEKERRADRLENATLRAASTGVKIEVDEDGERKSKVVKFADPDDANTYIERMVSRGELDADELFDEKGRVNSEALIEALQDLVTKKPHLLASEAKAATPSKGRADGGKGSGPGKEVDDQSISEHLKRIQKRHTPGSVD